MSTGLTNQSTPPTDDDPGLDTAPTSPNHGHRDDGPAKDVPDAHPRIEAARPYPPREDLLEVWGDDGEVPAMEAPIRLIHLGQSATPLIPFTTDTVRADVHYCEEVEIRGYARCNGDGCILCRIGRHRDVRALLPVFDPTSRTVVVVAIPPSSRPGALRPQILPVLRSPRRMAMSIRRIDSMNFAVKSFELRDDFDDGADVIARFMSRWEGSQVDLASVYPRYADEDLAEIPGIRAHIQFSSELGRCP